MRSGMLWFDNNDQRDLEAKLRRAILYYRSKHHEQPTICYMHPSMLFDKPAEVAGLTLRASNTVLPHHFWIGQEEVEQGRVRPAAA